MISALMFKVLSFGGVAATATAGAVCYAYKDEISMAFKSFGKTSHNDEINIAYTYVVASYTTVLPKANSVQAIQTKTTENAAPKYLLNFVDKDKQTVQEKDVEIYKLPKLEETSKPLKMASLKTTSNLISKPLATGNTYLVRLSNETLKALEKSELKTFNVADQATPGINVGLFTLASGQAKLNKDKELSISSASLFVVKLSLSSTFATELTDKDEVSCSIGAIDKKIPCKIYKFIGNTADPFTQAKIKNINKSVTPSTDLTAGKYILVDLLGSSQTLEQLESQVVVFNKKDSTDVVLGKGIVEQLLLGSLPTSEQTKSNIYLVESTTSALRSEQGVANQDAYILTKGSELHPGLKTKTFAKGNYSCRVISGSVKYEDTNCKVFKYAPTTGNFAFDGSAYANDDLSIAEHNDLSVDKYQFVKLSSTLVKQLKTNIKGIYPTLDIVETSSKDAAWNNRLVALTKVKDMFAHPDGLTKLKSNTLLVRVKDKVETTAINTANAGEAKTPFVCQIGSTMPLINCKLYSLATPKNTNNISSDEISKMTTGKALTANFEAGNYYAIELTDPSKFLSLDEIKNQVITLKTAGDKNVDVVKLEFDQLIFGQVGKAAALQKRDEAIFIVEKASPEPTNTGNIIKPYRCKLSVAGGKLDNFDDACTITKLPTATDPAKIPSLQNLKTNTTTAAGDWKIKDAADAYYRVTFDKNKLYNINLDSFDTTEIKIQIIPNTNPATGDFGTVKLLHDITGAESKGKTKLLIGKVTSTTPTTAIAAGKCAFSVSKDTSFTCDVYKDTVDSNTTLASAVFATGSKATTAADLAQDKLVLIKINEPKDLAFFKSKTIIYKQEASADSAVVEFEIKGIMGGTIDTAAKLYYLNTPTE